MTNDEIRAMLYDIMEAYAGFDGYVEGIFKINSYLEKLKK